MEQYNIEERGLDLKDLFWSLLRSWRVLLVWAIVFTVLMGVFSYIRNGGEVDRAALIEELTRDQIRELNEVEDLYQQVQSMESDIDADPIMQMNPYEITQTTIQFYIAADSVVNEDGNVIRTYNEDLQAAYQARIADNDVRQGLADLTAAIPADMISNYVVVKMVGSSSLQISIISEDAQTCEQMADYVKQVLADYSDTLQQQIGAHELILVTENVQSGYNDGIDAQRIARADSLNSLRTKLTSKENSLSEEQRVIYDYDIEQIKLAAGEEIETESRISKKYLVIGFLLGCVLACIWVVLKYLLDGKLKTAEELKLALGGKYIGTIFQSGCNRKRFLGAVDTWMERQQYHNMSQTAEAQELIVSNVELLCHKNSIHTLYITGSSLVTEGNVELQGLIEALCKRGIQVEAGAAVTKDASSLEKMVQCGCVLFCEKVNQSRHQSILEEVCLCQTQQVKVLGAVLVV